MSLPSRFLALSSPRAIERSLRQGTFGRPSTFKPRLVAYADDAAVPLPFLAVLLTPTYAKNHAV